MGSSQDSNNEYDVEFNLWDPEGPLLDNVYRDTSPSSVSSGSETACRASSITRVFHPLINGTQQISI